MNNLSSPSLLNSYQIEKVSSEQSGLDPENSDSYRLSCRCGCRELDVIAHDPQGDILRPPIYTVCASCGDKVLLFNPTEHGYDAHCGGADCYKLSTENEARWKCPDCGSPGLVTTTFEYALEDDFVEAELTPTDPGIEEWFTWITVTHRCTNEESDHPVLDWECA